MKGRRIERIGLDIIMGSRAPEKRSDRVLDNWREPVLLRFLRLDLQNREEIERYVALNYVLDGLFRHGIKDLDTESLQAYVEEYIANERNDPEHYLFCTITPAIIRETLGQLQLLTRHILSMLADKQIDPNAIMLLNNFLLKHGAVPQIYLPLPGEEDQPMQFALARKWEKTPTHELRILEMHLLTRLYDTIMRHSHLYREPGGRSEYAQCPVCDRIFAKTRLDRLFCSYQCADSIAGRKIKYGRKTRSKTGTDT
jgi:hypothetical protein